MFGDLKPQDTVTTRDVRSGLGMLLVDGVLAQTMGVLTGGAFLVAFALLLGASNTVIGLLAALGPFAQILQIPSIFLVEKTRRRKLLTVISALIARAVYIPIALLPWIFPAQSQMTLFLLGLFLFFGISAVTAVSWNSWMRDFIPEQIMGRYFGRRMAIATAVGAVITLLAGPAVDFYKAHVENGIGIYTILFLVGAAAGITGTFFLSRIPEPRMPESPKGQGILKVLAQPFRNANYRKLLVFLSAWSFSVNLAAPFFVVYMLKRLELQMTYVILLSVLSQGVNVLFLRLWGRLADRFTNKSVLAASGPFFILCTLLWVFTTMPERYFLTIPLLIIIHALTGMSTAGINLAAGNMALKSAPKGEATAFLATNALVSGIAATIAPILGGLAADFFANQEVSMTISWANTSAGGSRYAFPAFSLRGLDFLFIASFVTGFYALHRLAPVKEEGEVDEDIVLDNFYSEVRRTARHISNVAGIRHITSFPFAILRTMRILPINGTSSSTESAVDEHPEGVEQPPESPSDKHPGNSDPPPGETP